VEGPSDEHEYGLCADCLRPIRRRARHVPARVWLMELGQCHGDHAWRWLGEELREAYRQREEADERILELLGPVESVLEFHATGFAIRDTGISIALERELPEEDEEGGRLVIGGVPIQEIHRAWLDWRAREEEAGAL
jgi:hypothetical protein